MTEHHRFYSPGSLKDFILETVGETVERRTKLEGGLLLRPSEYLMNLVDRWGPQTNVTVESLEKAKLAAKEWIDQLSLRKFEKAGLVFIFKSDFESLLVYEGFKDIWNELVKQQKSESSLNTSRPPSFDPFD